MTDNDGDYDPGEANESSPAGRVLRRRRSEESGGVAGSESSRKRARLDSSETKRGYVGLPRSLVALKELKEKIDKKLPQQEYNETLSLRVLRMALTLQEEWLQEKARNTREGQKTRPPQVRETVGRLLGVGSKCYGRILQQYLGDQSIYQSTRAGNSRPKESRVPNTKAVQVLVRNFVRDYRKRMKRVTGRQVLDFMLEKELLSIDIEPDTGTYTKKGFATGYRNVRRWLERNGYQRGRRKGNVVPRADVAIKRDVYLKAFFANRDLPKDTQLREVYLDESYIHEHYHRFDDSLWDPSDEQDLEVGKRKHKGRRYCFLAAIEGADPRVDQPSPIAKEKGGLVRGSLWYFCPQKKSDSTGDYHKVFNSTNFVAWWKNQLLPNLHQPSLIMMDNAKYHLTYPLDIPKVDKLRKADTIAFLERKGVIYEAKDTVAILHKRAKDYIEAFEMRECVKLAHEQGHTVLMTPPYHSDFQPIELLWARIKGEVGRQYDNETTLALVLERLQAAFDRVQTFDGHSSVEGMIRASAKIAKAFYDRTQQEEVNVDVVPESDDEDEEEAPHGVESGVEDADDLRQGASDAEGSYGETEAV
jgi:transposase